MRCPGARRCREEVEQIPSGSASACPSLTRIGSPQLLSLMRGTLLVALASVASRALGPGGQRTPEAFVVFRRSRAVSRGHPAVQQRHPFAVTVRAQTVADVTLAEGDWLFAFTTDAALSSPGAAASGRLTRWRPAVETAGHAAVASPSSGRPLRDSPDDNAAPMYQDGARTQ